MGRALSLLGPLCMVVSKFVNVERMELSQKFSLVPMSEPRETLPITLASGTCLENSYF